MFTIQPSATTSTVITYMVNVAGGTCTGTDAVSITVNPSPVAGAIVGATAGAATICLDSTLILAPSTSPSPTTNGVVIGWNSSNPVVQVSNGVVTVIDNISNVYPLTAAISYTITFNGCTVTSPAYALTVNDCSGGATPAPNTPVCVAPKAFLEGPFEASTQLMNDDLRQLSHALSVDLTDDVRTTSPFPLSEPYAQLNNFTHVGGGGGETTTTSVLNVTGNKAVVDWVFLELRSVIDSSVVATRSALMLRDGSIVDAGDGVGDVCFTTAAGNYHLAVRHRNHLGILSKSPVGVSTATNTIVDMRFTSPSIPNYMAVSGTHPVDTIGSAVVMWGGDASSNGQTIFNGPGNDRDAVFFEIFLDPANTTNSYNHIRSGYYNGDTNLDGQVKYQGPTNDLDQLMFFNVLFYPNTIGIPQIISQQLP